MHNWCRRWRVRSGTAAVGRPGGTGATPATRGAATHAATTRRRTGLGRPGDAAGRAEAGSATQVAAGGRDRICREQDALKRYLEQGFLALDNNLSERTLRAIALGRNNWGVIGSEMGGRTAAVLFSVVGTCKGSTRSRTCGPPPPECSRWVRSRRPNNYSTGSRIAGC
ncbi:IS66 family transposase [Frigoriglobus tundricola]|uniref:IS66 family transposase n=1 Tax=Frigoriglobus tundricola TaxID=2774151 RepID=UPI0036F3AA14